MEMKVKTTVVIPNYNGMKYLPDCINSLKELEEPFQVLVVDNGSSDGSVEYLKSIESEDVKVIYLKENTGFCGGVNSGIRASETPFVLLLNNDTVVRPKFVASLEKKLETEKRAFSVSALMVDMKNPELVDDAGDSYCALGWAFARDKGKHVSTVQKGKEVFAACGGAAIYRKEILDRIGLFDENHFAYLEDIDIGYRAKIFGYRNYFEPEAVVLHAGSAVSGSRYNAFKVDLSSRNSVYLIYKNMPLLQILVNAPFLITGFLIKTLFFMRKGLGKNYVRGLWKGVRLSVSEKGRKHKVIFQMSHFCNYLRIQLELWKNMVLRFL